MQEYYEESISLTIRIWSSRNSFKKCKKVGNANGSSHALHSSKSNDFKSKFACILEASESTRMRVEETLPKCHEDHNEGKGDKSPHHYNLVHQLVLMHQAMKIPAAKDAVDEEWEKLPTWDLTKVRSKSEVVDEARTKGAKNHFPSQMDICHQKNAELETKHQKYKGRVVLRGHTVKDGSGSYAVFTEQGSSASQMMAAKVMDIISRLPDAVSVYTQVTKEDAHKLLKNSKIGMSRHLDSSTPTQMA